MRFTEKDLGCYADGAFGHQHCRERLAELLEQADIQHAGLIASLRGEMPDDASDEDDAIDLLNELCEDEVFFCFHDGDLMLVQGDDGES